MTIEVRQVTDDDKPALAAVMARAFERDPALAWVFRDEATRRARLEGLFALALADISPPDNEVLTTPDLGGVAVWNHRRPASPASDGAAPDPEAAAAERQLFGDAMTASGFLAEETDRMLTFLGIMDDHHPHEPEHWYLGILAADGDRQGRGIGSACMGAKLVDLDRAGLPAYLESSNERNVPLYERHGFRVTGVIDLPDGPPLWAMWREPAPAGST